MENKRNQARDKQKSSASRARWVVFLFVFFKEKKELSMKLGVVGLPNVGKSTLFNALTKAGAQSANYPFCTIEPNVGVVAVPDKRVDTLANMYHSKSVVPAYIEFVDIAGLVAGASKGEGLGNQFLAHIREVDAIVHVVRCFDDTNIVHVEGNVAPKRDTETINTELLLADLDTAQKRLDKGKKVSKSGDKATLKQVAVLEKVLEHLDSGQPVRNMELNGEETEIVRELFLLTSKPVIYVANIAEEDIGKDLSQLPYAQQLSQIAQKENAQMITVSAKVEEDLSTLEEGEKKEFLQELGLDQGGLDKLIVASYQLLGLISFLTSGEDETRAWTITKGTKAPQAAGKIHTDFERGFIRAEVVGYDVLMEYGSIAATKEAGQYRLEGKEYVVQDGDIIVFRFNV